MKNIYLLFFLIMSTSINAQIGFNDLVENIKQYPEHFEKLLFEERDYPTSHLNKNNSGTEILVDYLIETDEDWFQNKVFICLLSLRTNAI